MHQRKVVDLNDPYIDSPTLIRELQRKMRNKGRPCVNTPNFSSRNNMIPISRPNRQQENRSNISNVSNVTNRANASNLSHIRNNGNIVDSKMVQCRRVQVRGRIGGSFDSFGTKETRENSNIKDKKFYRRIEENKTKKKDTPFDLIENHKLNSLFHRYLPKKYRNDENYKGKLLQFIKSENIIKIPNDKIHSKPLKNIANLVEKQFEEDCYLTKSKIPSARLIPTNRILLQDSNNKMIIFPLFRDEDLGLEQKWREKIIYFSEQEDIDSSSSVVEGAVEASIDAVKKGLEEFRENKMSVRNYKRFTKTEEDIFSLQ